MTPAERGGLPVLAAPGLPGFGYLGGAVANSRGEQAPGLFTSVPLKHALPCLPAQVPKSGGPDALGWRHRRRFAVCGLACLEVTRLRVARSQVEPLGVAR